MRTGTQSQTSAIIISLDLKGGFSVSTDCIYSAQRSENGVLARLELWFPFSNYDTTLGSFQIQRLVAPEIQRVSLRNILIPV